MTIKEFIKDYVKEVILPVYFGSVLGVGILGSAHKFANYMSPPNYPSHLLQDPRFGVTEQIIDEDGDGTLDTKVTVIPRAGIIKQRIENPSLTEDN